MSSGLSRIAYIRGLLCDKGYSKADAAILARQFVEVHSEVFPSASTVRDIDLTIRTLEKFLK